MEKKYELISSDKPGLYRIRALRDLHNVKKGTIGGYIQSNFNLSQEGECWIYPNVIVRDNALVTGNAIISGNCTIYDNANIYGNSTIFGNIEIYDNADISGNVWIRGNSVICENAVITDDIEIIGSSVICGQSYLHGIATIRDATIKSNKDYIIFKNWWSSGRYFVWTRSNDLWTVGCFHGTGTQLIEKAYRDSEISGREYKRIVDYVESIKPYLNDLYK